MVKIIHNGDLFNSQCQTLVNTVNCVGVMGKGIALSFKQRYPDMFKRYQEICRQQLLNVGKLWLWKGDIHWVLNFPTKIHWRNPSQIEWIERGLDKFVETYHDKGITSIAFPALGCNNGGLSKEVVIPIMEEKLRQCTDIDIEIYC